MTLSEGTVNPMLSAARLSAAVVRPGGLWRQVTVVAETGSTNADLLALAATGGEAGTVLAAETQHAGRGRLGRSWTSAAGAGLTFSVLLRPAGVPATRLGWLPLLTGVAVAAAVHQVTGVDARLKWPNDVLAGERKLAGILAESRGPAVVVGVGLNVSQRADSLPVPTATSLLLEQEPLAGPAGWSREQVLAGILAGIDRWYPPWTAAAGDPDACGLRAEYLRRCATLGREVRVLLPGGRSVTGQAADVDPLGRLVVAAAAGPVEVSAGDVVHVR
jgi:BirA family biotin operon repressor/biotin-[acetyl-CoA-carboxylase] ligase